MIILHQPPGAFGVTSLSPFCIKLECYLKMAGLPYTARKADFRKAPKGKVPFIEEDGQMLGDSQLIIEHLKRKHGDPLDAKLSPEQLATGHLVRRALEDSLYWNIGYERWVDEEGWRVYRPLFEAMFPPVVGKVVVPMIRRDVRRALKAQGLLRHRPEEIVEQGKADVSAVATVLGDKAFLLGEAPTSFDATLYAFIKSIIAFPVDSPLKRFTLAQPNLVRYCERFEQRYFPDAKPAAAAA
ncbi:MAG TPA: glutathione S-transferase family protein [Myxococcaceae bacterium]|nr:glutathione S-transferase family protein [Myxococcaceae bacterium]